MSTRELYVSCSFLKVQNKQSKLDVVLVNLYVHILAPILSTLDAKSSESKKDDLDTFTNRLVSLIIQKWMTRMIQYFEPIIHKWMIPDGS